MIFILPMEMLTRMSSPTQIFSNDERGLVLYHNRFADTKGWIKTSAAYLDKSTGDLRQKSLAEALGLPFEGYVIFKDYVTRLEYIRSCEELWSKGLYVELHAYQHHVFMDFRFIDDEKWRDIYVALNGAGVESMSAKWEEMFGVKDEGGMMKDEEVKVKKPRKKAVKKKEERGKKVVGGKITAVKKAKPAVTKLVTKKAVVKKKSAVKKPVVKKSTAKASKSKPKANRKKVVKKPAKR
jgi:hypothetical protein